MVAMAYAESNPEADPEADHPARPSHPHEVAPYHEPPPYLPNSAPYHPAPYHHHNYHHGPPRCAKGNPKTFCLDDYEYPTYEIQSAIEFHYDVVQQLYKDVVANTENSVDNLRSPEEETYVCPTETNYITPLRAVNSHGKWRIIVNDVSAHFEYLSQTARIEECTTPNEKCPLVPEPYDTKCVQKNVYHRFLIYDPLDEFLPFAIESFPLPSACACYTNLFEYTCTLGCPLG